MRNSVTEQTSPHTNLKMWKITQNILQHSTGGSSAAVTLYFTPKIN